MATYEELEEVYESKYKDWTIEQLEAERERAYGKNSEILSPEARDKWRYEIDHAVAKKTDEINKENITRPPPDTTLKEPEEGEEEPEGTPGNYDTMTLEQIVKAMANPQTVSPQSLFDGATAFGQIGLDLNTLSLDLATEFDKLAGKEGSWKGTGAEQFRKVGKSIETFVADTAFRILSGSHKNALEFSRVSLQTQNDALVSGIQANQQWVTDTWNSWPIEFHTKAWSDYLYQSYITNTTGAARDVIKALANSYATHGKKFRAVPVNPNAVAAEPPKVPETPKPPPLPEGPKLPDAPNLKNEPPPDLGAPDVPGGPDAPADPPGFGNEDSPFGDEVGPPNLTAGADADGDGIPDALDPDAATGPPNLTAPPNLTGPPNFGAPGSVGAPVDLDGDGKPDGLAVDSDGNGIPDGVDIDGDGKADAPLPDDFFKGTNPPGGPFLAPPPPGLRTPPTTKTPNFKQPPFKQPAFKSPDFKQPNVKQPNLKPPTLKPPPFRPSPAITIKPPPVPEFKPIKPPSNLGLSSGVKSPGANSSLLSGPGKADVVVPGRRAVGGIPGAALAGRGGPMGPMGGYPPPMGGGMGAGGQQQGQERERTTWLMEDEEVWAGSEYVPPSVLGRPADD